VNEYLYIGMTWKQHCTRLICTKQVMNLDTEHLPTEIRYLFIPDECIEFHLYITYF
jgi:hypothetical protein